MTAGSRGIGKGIVRVLAESGAKVMATALTDQYLGPLADEMAQANHPIETITADATKAEDWQRTMEAALAAWGHVDVLVNTLGDAIRRPIVALPDQGPDARNMTDDEWRFILDINLTQCFLGCRAVGPHFIDRGKGKVINISSFPDTDLIDDARLDAARQRAEATVPIGRFGNIREVGLLALYLASDASNFMTGETLHLDGGFTHP